MSTGRARWRVAIGAVVFSLLATCLAPAVVAGEGEARTLRVRPLAGLSLEEALLELRRRGVDLVFTDRVVEPAMRVEAEPTGSSADDLLQDLLAPHGLIPRQPVAGVFVITESSAPPASGSLRGLVRSGADGAPIAGAEVQLVDDPPVSLARCDAYGRFAIDLAAGRHGLRATAEGFLAGEPRILEMAAAGPRELVFVLEPIPFVQDEIAVRSADHSWLGDQPAAPFSLSADDLAALPHLGGDLFRALSLLPGTSANDLTAQVSVRGGRRDEVQIVLDGQELYDAFHLQDFDNALSLVPAEDLHQVQLNTGAFPAQWGDRMGGVLDMRTRTPRSPTRTRLGLSLLNASLTNSGTFSLGHDRSAAWLGSLRRGTVDLASRLIDREDPTYWDAFGKLEGDHGGGQRWRLQALAAGDALDFRERDGDESKAFDTEYESLYLWLTHEATLGDRGWLQSRLSRSAVDRHRRGIEDEEEQSFEVSDRRAYDVVSASQSWLFQATPRQTLEAGLEGRLYDAEYAYGNEIDLELVLDTPLNDLRQPQRDFAAAFEGEHWSAFATQRLRPTDALTIESGVRWDRHTLTDDNLWSPRLAVAWQPGERSVLRASWGHFFQSHRPYELEVEDGATAFQPAERSVHRSLAFEHLFGHGPEAPLAALRLEIYRRDVRDPRPRFENLFEASNVFPEIEPDRVLVTPEDSTMEGLEMQLRGALGGRAHWWLTYAWAEAEDRIAGRDVPRPLDQSHTANGILRRQLGGDWFLTLALRYRTGWPTTAVFSRQVEDDDGELETEVFLGPLYGERLPDYHRLDLRLSRRWRLARGDFELFADIQNVYDRRNTAGFDLALDDDELVIQDEQWSGIFPSLGLKWEF